MLNAVYQLKKPRQFELVFKDITFDQEPFVMQTRDIIRETDQMRF